MGIDEHSNITDVGVTTFPPVVVPSLFVEGDYGILLVTLPDVLEGPIYYIPPTLPSSAC